jgi:hypothetical protein
MELAHRWGDRNLSKMELIMAVLILSIMIGIFSRYMLSVFARAEQSLVSSTVININTALHYRASLAVIQDDYQQLEELEKINPMEDMHPMYVKSNYEENLSKVPIQVLSGAAVVLVNYGGTIVSDELEVQEKGQWYFNVDKNLIEYMISNNEFFDSDIVGPRRIRFRVALDYEDRNANKQYDPDIDEFKTLRLKSIDDYRWNL